MARIATGYFGDVMETDGVRRAAEAHMSHHSLGIVCKCARHLPVRTDMKHLSGESVACALVVKRNATHPGQYGNQFEVQIRKLFERCASIGAERRLAVGRAGSFTSELDD